MPAGLEVKFDNDPFIIVKNIRKITPSDQIMQT